MNTLYTLDGEQGHEEEIRRSRFLARAAPVTDMRSAMDFVERASNSSATHNCWAWRIGQAYRFHDDGEPGGSAGRPILQAIDGRHMDAVAVVVTRWFGGIKLGVGGLIRAYGGTAAECLRRAARRPLVDTVQVHFSLGYAALPLFKARTQDWHLALEGEEFGAGTVEVTASVAREHVDALQRLLADLSRGRSRLRVLEEGKSDTP